MGFTGVMKFCALSLLNVKLEGRFTAEIFKFVSGVSGKILGQLLPTFGLLVNVFLATH